MDENVLVRIRPGKYSSPLGDLEIEARESGCIVQFAPSKKNIVSFVFGRDGTFCQFFVSTVVEGSKSMESSYLSQIVSVCEHIRPGYRGDIIRIGSEDEVTPVFACSQCSRVVSTLELREGSKVRIFSKDVWNKLFPDHSVR